LTPTWLHGRRSRSTPIRCLPIATPDARDRHRRLGSGHRRGRHNRARRRGAVPPAGGDAATRSLAAAERLVVERYAHPPLRPRTWQLRDNVSYYDGLYVALAEAARLPLVTADAKLAKAHGPRCPIELV
jgi:hypothetical protein